MENNTKTDNCMDELRELLSTLNQDQIAVLKKFLTEFLLTDGLLTDGDYDELPVPPDFPED